MSQEHFADNFIPVIPIGYSPFHIEHQTFCYDPTCGCHEELELIQAVNDHYQAGLLTDSEALRTIQGKQI